MGSQIQPLFYYTTLTTLIPLLNALQFSNSHLFLPRRVINLLIHSLNFNLSSTTNQSIFKVGTRIFRKFNPLSLDHIISCDLASSYARMVSCLTGRLIRDFMRYYLPLRNIELIVFNSCGCGTFYYLGRRRGLKSKTKTDFWICRLHYSAFT